MGTRAIVTIQDKEQNTLLTFYRQMDGYPEGLGMELRDAVRGVKLVNGFSGDDAIPETFNGIECFAAWLIGHLKGDEIGSVYIFPAGTSDVGEEYTYLIRPTKSGRIQVICSEVT